MTPLDGSTETTTEETPQSSRHIVARPRISAAAFCPTAEALRDSGADGGEGANRGANREESENDAESASAFLDDALRGLSATPKQLSPKYFYDRAGSLLFDAICELPEYYVTRTELAILTAHAGKIADRLGAEGSGRVRVIEPGAGSGTKTRLLLRALGPERCVEYVPVDIDGQHLAHTAERLRRELPWLRVSPFAGDFTVDLPVSGGRASSKTAGDARNVIYFPGSTIGNFEPLEAARLLARFRRAAGPGGALLLGVDLKKDPALLHAAYNDAKGITAAFNKNVLRRMNDELDADFDVERFHHYALYSPVLGRIEMHLVSAERQEVRLGERTVTFEEGESLCTEHSYKYDVASAERLAASAGLDLEERWLDADRRFAVLLFRVRGD